MNKLRIPSLYDVAVFLSAMVMISVAALLTSCSERELSKKQEYIRILPFRHGFVIKRYKDHCEVIPKEGINESSKHSYYSP